MAKGYRFKCLKCGYDESFGYGAIMDPNAYMLGAHYCKECKRHFNITRVLNLENNLKSDDEFYYYVDGEIKEFLKCPICNKDLEKISENLMDKYEYNCLECNGKMVFESYVMFD